MLISRLYVLAAALLFSTGGTAIKLSALSNWQIAAFRSGVAALLLWMLLPAWRARLRLSSLAVAAAYAATLVLFVSANTLTSAANAIFLQYSAPLYVLLLGPRLLGEPNRRSDLAVIALLAAGMLLFFVAQEIPTRTAPNPAAGNLIGVASGITWALTLLGLRLLGRGDDPDRSAGGAVIAGNALAFACCLPATLRGPSATAVDAGVVVYLGAFQIAAAYVCLLRGVRSLRALEVSLLLAIEPVASAIWAWRVHGEMPVAAAAAGCGLIFAGVLAQLLSGNPKHPEGNRFLD